MSANRIRILHLEDNTEDLLLVRSVLEAGGLDCEIVHADSRDRFEAALDSTQPLFDLIISDYALPSFDGITALRLVRERGLELPFIFVSGTMGEELAVETLKAGATDYILKDRLARLVPSVQQALEGARGRALRRQADEEIRRSEERFQIVARVTNDAVWDWDLKTGAFWWNEGFQRLFGYGPEEVGSGVESWTGRIHPDALDRVVSGVHAAMDGDAQSWSDEYLFRKGDGNFASVFDRGSVIRDSSGAPVRMIGAMTDITERKRAEQRIVTMGQINHVLATARTRHEGVSKVLQEICERSCWLIAEHWSPTADRRELHREVFWTETPAEFPLFLASAESDPAPREGLVARAWASGKPEWVADVAADPSFERLTAAREEGLHSAFAFPRIVGDVVTHVLLFFSREVGRPVADLHGILEEIGPRVTRFLERLAIEEVLRQSEEKYRSIIETTNEWIWATDIAGRRTYSNPAVETILGYTSAEMMAKHSLELIHPEDRPRFEDLLIRATADRTGWNGVTVRCRHKNGGYRLLDSNAIPIFDSHGALQGWRGADRDITDRTQLEAQLRQSQKMEAVGTLAGGVAHDFNNLLTTIIGYADLGVGQLPVGHPAREDLTEVLKAAERAAVLTRQLLAFSRKQLLTPVVLDLNKVVLNLEKMLGRLIGENIEIATVLGPALPCVKADAGQIDSIIVNLVVNAKDAMPQGGRITIETSATELTKDYAHERPYVTPGSHVLLSVTDTGSGMDSETRARIFEPFFTTKEMGKGTGLGLSTVYGIVKQSEGSIEVDTEPGKGTTFRIYFPAIQERIVEPVRSSIPEPDPGSETILLVEDEEGLRSLARRALLALGYAVLDAPDGARAIEISQAHPGAIALLLTDMVMPGLSGPELARQLAAERPKMKVLFVSGYTDDAMARGGYLDAGTAFLPKPFTLNALGRKVSEVLGRLHGVSSEPPRPN